jgi:hypothetical protein
MMQERRRVMRVTPLHPIAARVNGDSSYILDASLNGLQLCHHRMLRPGIDCYAEFDFDGVPIGMTVMVQWSRLQRPKSASRELSLYVSGTEILLADDRSRAALRNLVESEVLKALDEQKANAKGIPPLAAQSVMSSRADVFARHEFANGLWRRLTTTDARQPLHGFTIAAELPSHEVEMLRSAYTIADDPTKNIIQKLAELSIDSREPIPMRRYTP